MEGQSEQMKIINVGAISGGDAFLILTNQKTMLIDSGFAFYADKMIERIRQELDGRTLDYCLLTHSHYDHASGSAYLPAAFPAVKIIASAYAASVLQKPSAISVIREMNRAAATEYGAGEFEDRLDDLRVDMIAGEGDTISLGTRTLEVIGASGHTKCSIACYVPEERLLISCETMGVYAGNGVVVPCYLVGYEMSMVFMKRVCQLDPERILIPHYGVISGAECKAFPAAAIKYGQLLKEWILKENKMGYDYETIGRHYKEEFYTDAMKRIQPLKAFELNASYTIPMIIREATSHTL